MSTEGTLSIVRVGNRFDVRFASTNLHTSDRQVLTCTDTDQLDTLLHHCGVDAWSIARAKAELRHGRCAVLFIVVSAAQVEACFGEVGEQGMTKPQEQGMTKPQEQDACEARQVRRTAPQRVSTPETSFVATH